MGMLERVGKSQIIVPSSYIHQSEIDFAARVARESGTMELWEKGLTSINFASATNRLIRNRTYYLQIFQVKQKVTCERSLRFLAEQKALLVGAQCLTLVQRLEPRLFPFNKYVFSLDVKTALWADGSIYRMPFVCNFPTHGWRFGLGDYREGLDEDCCLLCVTTKPPLS